MSRFSSKERKAKSICSIETFSTFEKADRSDGRGRREKSSNFRLKTNKKHRRINTPTANPIDELFLFAHNRFRVSRRERELLPLKFNVRRAKRKSFSIEFRSLITDFCRFAFVLFAVRRFRCAFVFDAKFEMVAEFLSRIHKIRFVRVNFLHRLFVLPINRENEFLRVIDSRVEFLSTIEKTRKSLSSLEEKIFVFVRREKKERKFSVFVDLLKKEKLCRKNFVRRERKEKTLFALLFLEKSVVEQISRFLFDKEKKNERRIRIRRNSSNFSHFIRRKTLDSVKIKPFIFLLSSFSIGFIFIR